MSQFALPISDISKASWSQLAGDSDVVAFDELDEGFGIGRGTGNGPDDDTTAWQTDSKANVTRTIECGLSPLINPYKHSGHIIRARVSKSATSGASLTGTLYLFEGAVQRAASAATAITATTYTTISYTLSAAETAAIVNYSALRLRLVMVIGSGTSRRGRVSALELEIPDWAHAIFKRIKFLRSQLTGGANRLTITLGDDSTYAQTQDQLAACATVLDMQEDIRHGVQAPDIWVHQNDDGGYDIATGIEPTIWPEDEVL
jgi:hypothetical protein